MGVEELGAAIRHLRRQQGLSQQALAERSGLSRNFVAQIERGESAPTVATLSRLAAALQTPVAALLGEELAGGGEAVELAPVPLVADRIAAGAPRFVADRTERLEPLPRTLLRSVGVDPRQAVLIRLGLDQDSMADTIPPGATVLVDRTPVREVTPREIYAIREETAGDTGCSIKRLVLDIEARVLIVLSDNPAYLPRAIRLRADQSLADHIVGRVAWWLPRAP